MANIPKICSTIQLPSTLNRPFAIHSPYTSYIWGGRDKQIWGTFLERGSELHAKAEKYLRHEIIEAKKVERKPLIAIHMPYRWNRGQQIRVRFMEGDSNLHAKVEKYAKIWTQYANLDLVFGNDHNADVRVSFRPGSSWSNIGTHVPGINLDMPTMNIDWVEGEDDEDVLQAIALHEFGHVLGCIHEHQSPGGGIKWNKPVVYDHYANLEPPWSQQLVDDNILTQYTAEQTQYTQFDPSSIMIYPIPKSFTTNGFEVSLNKELSEADKGFISVFYPY